jgi:putative ABC transport system permease protein
MQAWRTAARIAWREARASASKFAFVIAAVAIGVAALTGVRGFSESFRSMLLRDARGLMAADISVRIFGHPSSEQLAAVSRLGRRGVDETRVLETLSMVTSAKQADPVLVSVKAVDPRQFPFYGIVQLQGDTRLRDVLDATHTVVSQDLALRLHVTTGDTLRIGGQDFQIAGVVIAEPDRMSGSLNVGPRLIISHDGLERTGLVRLGTRSAQRLLFRMRPGSPPIERVQAALHRAFPEALIVDFREINPNISRGLNRATMFLSLVSLIALVVGAIGVASAMHAHLQQKMDSIAVMKSIGARSAQVIRIYTLQTLMLGTAGGVLGVLLGLAVQHVFPALIQRYFQMQPEIAWHPLSALQGLSVGVLITLLFTVPPLLSIRNIRPGLILRRDMEDVRLTWRQRFFASRATLLSGAAILIGIGATAAWLSGGSFREASRIGGYFVGGLVGSLVVLTFVAVILLRSLRLLVRANSQRMSSLTRHGIANLYRPGSQARPVLTALGVGVMFTLTVYLVQRSVLAEIVRSAPPGMANVFFLDITPDQRRPLAELISSHTGVERPPEVISTVSCRLVSINGVTPDRLNLSGGWARRYRMSRAIATAAEMPSGAKIVQGAWWPPANSEPAISVSQSAARALRLSPGAIMEWNAFGKVVQARVAAVHTIEDNRLIGAVEFIMSPGVLEGAPTVFYAAARVKPADIATLQRASFERFPTVTVVNIADVLERVQDVVDQIALVIRFISFFSIVAGAVILASSVAGTRFRRVREVVIFKTLGATRRRIAAMFSVEFLILGTVAGLMGSAMASAFSWLLLYRLFDAPFRFDPMPNLAAIALTSLVAAASGWLASFRILGQKPLEILRGE